MTIDTKRKFSLLYLCALFPCCFVEAQDNKDLLKSFVNDNVKLDFRMIEAMQPDSLNYVPDSLRVSPEQQRYNEGFMKNMGMGRFNCLDIRNNPLLRKWKYGDSLTISENFFKPYTNPKPKSHADERKNLELNGAHFQMETPSGGAKGGIPENYSRRKERRDKYLKIITKEIYPTDTVK